MLNDLSIKNFAIIDELHVSFSRGLNIISGETGAGKSIIIGAVSLLLGDRATVGMIRTQADAATVEALFDITGNRKLKEKIAALGFTTGDELVIRRVISRTGKNKALINGEMATMANLAAISESLINICGQHEHQIILDAENHVDILDEFGGCLPQRTAYEEVYNQYRLIKVQMAKLEDLIRSRKEKAELIEFQLKEIADVEPQADEDRTLTEERKVLVNIRKLVDAASRAYDLLYGEASSVIEKLKDVQSHISDIRKIDTCLNLPAADVEDSFFALQETALALRDYAKKLFPDPDRLAVIDERLEILGRLKRKHGGSLVSVLHRQQEMAHELRKVFTAEEEIETLAREEIKVKVDMEKFARRLSQLRLQAAAKLKDAVNKELHDLNMPHASFLVNFISDAADTAPGMFGPRGGDELEFYLAANVGEEPKALNCVASGGELSRIVLALKNVLSPAGSVGTVVFDEVDSGIGGATAEIVGRKLKEISVNHQVICITHLPQIACYGENLLRVSKAVVDGRTTTAVDELADEQKIEEISRMLGGIDLTETTRDHAREMLEGARTPCPECRKGKNNVEKGTHR
jgi:DNA repair protein RecN (Recombination protein N)